VCLSEVIFKQGSRTSILGGFAELRKVTIGFVMSDRSSVRPSAWNISAPTGPIVIKFDIRMFVENLSRKFKFHENLKRITGILHEHLCAFMEVSR